MTHPQQVDSEQEEARKRFDILRREITLRREKGSENRSELGTKHLDQTTMWRHIAALDFKSRDGKSELRLGATL